MFANVTWPFCKVHDYLDCFNTSLSSSAKAKACYVTVSAKTRDIVSWTIWYQWRLRDLSFRHVNRSLCFRLEINLRVKGCFGLITFQKYHCDFILLKVINVSSSSALYIFHVIVIFIIQNRDVTTPDKMQDPMQRLLCFNCFFN